MSRLTAVEIAAFLGLSASRIRHVIREHRIPSKGKSGRAKLYDARTVIDAAGPWDRATGNTSAGTCDTHSSRRTIDVGDRIPSRGRSPSSRPEVT